MRLTFPGFLVQVLYFIVALAEVVIGLRFILRLLGASSQAPFSRWVYDMSDTLLSPFRGIFTSPAIDGGFVIDFTALFAIVIYAIAAYLLAELIYTVSLGAPERRRR